MDNKNSETILVPTLTPRNINDILENIEAAKQRRDLAQNEIDELLEQLKDFKEPESKRLVQEAISPKEVVSIDPTEINEAPLQEEII